MTLAHMGELGYNTGVNHIKSGQVLLAPTHPFSTDVRGIDTMSDHTPQVPAFKVCPQCCESKSSSEFYRHPKRYDGLASWCKSCTAEYSRAYKQANKEKLVAQRHALYVANKEKSNAQTRAWAAANPDRVAEINRRHNAANKEGRAAQKRAWVAANREKVRAMIQRRRARKLNASGTHTAEDVHTQYKAQKGKCYYCGKKVGKAYHADHVVPLARGGSDGIENIVISCIGCNQAKHTRLPHEWPQGGRLL